MLSEESRYKLLKALEANPGVSQRDLALELGISLGKVNYCLKALVEKGWVKASNFTKSSNKLGYAYILTPSGVEEKLNVTLRFLKHKLEEHKQIQRDIDELREEVSQIPVDKKQTG